MTHIKSFIIWDTALTESNFDIMIYLSIMIAWPHLLQAFNKITKNLNLFKHHVFTNTAHFLFHKDVSF